MADTINLEIVTPERMLLQADVDSVQVPGLEGEMGILPGHTPLISQLKPSGLLSYVLRGENYQLVISDGFVEVLPDQVKVLAEVAEHPEDIDVARAIRARERAERLLAQAVSDPNIDTTDANQALARALTRIEAAEKK